MSSINLSKFVQEPDFSKLKCPFRECDCVGMMGELCRGDYEACGEYKMKLKSIEERR